MTISLSKFPPRAGELWMILAESSYNKSANNSYQNDGYPSNAFYFVVVDDNANLNIPCARVNRRCLIICEDGRLVLSTMCEYSIGDWENRSSFLKLVNDSYS